MSEYYARCNMCHHIIKNETYIGTKCITKGRYRLCKGVYQKILFTLPNMPIKYTYDDLRVARFTGNYEMYHAIKKWLVSEKERLKKENTKEILDKDKRIKKQLKICNVIGCLEERFPHHSICERHYKNTLVIQENQKKKDFLIDKQILTIKAEKK